MCDGSDPTTPRTQVYGIYNDSGELVSVMAETYTIVFPHEDGSRIVMISGASTKEGERKKGYASKLLKAIEKDAKDYFHADYLCLDSTADKFYSHYGYKKAPENETRMWKKL